MVFSLAYPLAEGEAFIMTVMVDVYVPWAEGGAQGFSSSPKGGLTAEGAEA